MSSTCLSLPTILRCASLTRNQTIALLVPPGLQIIFAIGLVVCMRGKGRKHFLLVGETWAMFILALLDFLAHIIPAARTSMNVFKSFDIVIGALTFAPVVLYTLYLFLLSRSHLIPILPRRFQSIAKYTLLTFIPIIAALNELGSFVGISYRDFVDRNGNSVLTVGYAKPMDQSTWLFLNSLALALLTAYQAIVFCLAFFKLAQAFINQRRIDSSTRPDEEAHLIQGLGWLVAGIKLGAVEVVIGFAGETGGFGAVFSRRFLRLIARACLAIGIVKGMDSVEDFSLLEPRGGRRNQSGARSRLKISAPRSNTFAQLSPHASAFHSLPRAAKNGGANATAQKDERRVTLHYDGLNAPKLEMRLSDLNMPSPAVIAERVERASLEHARDEARLKVRRTSEAFSWSMLSDPRPSNPRPSVNARDVPVAVMDKNAANTGYSYNSIGSTRRQPVRNNSSESRHASTMSTNSITSDSLDVVRQIAEQFPGLPPRVTGRYRGSILGRLREEDSVVSQPTRAFNSQNPGRSRMLGANAITTENPFEEPEGATVSRVATGDSQKSQLSVKSSSLKRKAVPIPAPIDSVIAAPQMNVQVSGGSYGSSTRGFPKAGIRAAGGRSSQNSMTSFDNTPGLTMGQQTEPTTATTEASNPFLYDTEYRFRDSTLTSQDRGFGRIAERVTKMERDRALNEARRPGNKDPIRNASEVRARLAATRQRDSPSRSTHGSIENAWPDYRQSSGTETASQATLDAAWRKSGLTDVPIKGVGRVATRRTPEPTQSRFNRESIRAERHDFDYYPEVSTSKEEINVLQGGRPRQDSGILVGEGFAR